MSAGAVGRSMDEMNMDERNFGIARIFSFVHAVSAVYRMHGALVFLTIKEYRHEALENRARRRVDRRACSRHLECIA